MPTREELLFVAFELAHRQGAGALEVAARWQADFLHSGDDIPSSSWGAIRRMIADLQRPGPRAGESVQ